MTYEELCEERAAIQSKAEGLGLGDKCWAELGVANRHLERLSKGILKLTPGIEAEIRLCFWRVRKNVLNERPQRIAQGKN